MLKTYKYRLYPNNIQKDLINKHIGCARWIYNYGLENKIKHYEKKQKTLSYFNLANKITKIKKMKKYSWLQEVQAQTLQMSLRNLENAFTSFFKQHNKFPNFKNRYSKKSFQYPQNVKLLNNKIYLPKIGWVKIIIDRNFTGKIKTVTIVKTNTNKYFSCILIDDGIKIPDKVKIKKAIGIDVGIKTFATISSGEKIDNPRFLKKSSIRLGVLQKKLSKKRKGGKNREKAKFKVVLLHEKIKNQRKDFLHKLSSRLVDENQAIALEDLNIKGMVKNHCLAKAISDCSWSEFMTMLEYKSEWQGKHILKIGRFQPSSRICTCGEINHNLTLKDREWTCTKCGITHDRDILASQNILKFSGLVQPVEPVESPTLVGAMKQETSLTSSSLN